MGAAIATGNAAVMVPSMAQALVATDFYQVLDTSDLPGGVVNIVTGDKGRSASNSPSTMPSMPSGTSANARRRRRQSKRPPPATSSRPGPRRSPATGATRQYRGGREILQRATQVKNIWIPYGE